MTKAKEVQEYIDPRETFWEKMVQTPNGIFSVTRLLVIVSFAFSLLIGLTGLIVYLGWEIVLPSNLYSYIGALTGGGVFQYGITKVKDTVVEKRRKDNK